MIDNVLPTSGFFSVSNSCRQLFFVGFFYFKPSCLWEDHCHCSYWPESWVRDPAKRQIPRGTCPGQTGERDAEGRIVKGTPFSSRLPLDTLDHSGWIKEWWAESGAFHCLFKLSTQYSKIPKNTHPWSPLPCLVVEFDSLLQTLVRELWMSSLWRLSSLGWDVFNNCYPLSSWWQYFGVSGQKSSGGCEWTQQESGGWHGIR